MTVTYSKDVVNAGGIAFFRLLFLRWRGSVLKLLWMDLLVYLALFYTIHIWFVCLMTEDQQKHFRLVVDRFRRYEDVAPISFILGFFVAQVMSRWWSQYTAIPWPHSTAVYVSSNVHGYDEMGRAMRRTIMRYVNLCLAMVFRKLSNKVAERFPKMSDLVDVGLLMPSELEIIENVEKKYPGYGKNWMPIVWAAAIVTRARAEGRIRDDMAKTTLMESLNSFRGKCGTLNQYHTVNIPLVYTQVVGIAVYFFFFVRLFSHQAKKDLPIEFEFFPLLQVLQFFFYMGWFKAAETMLNPFGDDDDDFEVNKMIDQNLQISYLIVDEMHNEHPELLKDQYWNEILPQTVGKKDDGDKKPAEKAPEKTDNTETDIFDYEKLTRRRVTRNPGSIDVGSTASSVAVDLEVSSHSIETIKQDVPGTRSTSIEKKTLVPDANVIDPTYKKKADVEVQQSIINLWIQKSRVKNARSVPPSRIPSLTSRIPSQIKESSNSDDSEPYRSARASILGKPKSTRPSKNE